MESLQNVCVLRRITAVNLNIGACRHECGARAPSRVRGFSVLTKARKNGFEHYVLDYGAQRSANVHRVYLDAGFDAQLELVASCIAAALLLKDHKRNVTCSKLYSGGDQIGTICCKVHNRVDSSWSTLERDLITTACVWTVQRLHRLLALCVR